MTKDCHPMHINQTRRGGAATSTAEAWKEQQRVARTQGKPMFDTRECRVLRYEYVYKGSRPAYVMFSILTVSSAINGQMEM